MTYLFKLARRMAFALVTIAAAGCSDADSRDFLGPDPGTPGSSNTPASLHITPHAGAIAFDQAVHLTAWGRNAAGDSIAVAVSWTATSGQISPDGLFHGTATGNVTITAFALARPSVKTSTTIAVGSAGSIFTGLKILPEPVTVGPGATVAFAVTAKLATNGASTAPGVTWSTTGGTITTAGQYTAATQPGTYLVHAKTLDGALNASATVTVEEAWLTALQLTPKVVIVPSGAIQDFVVKATWSDGSTYLPELEWQTAAGVVVPFGALGGPQAAPGNGNGGGQLNAGSNSGNYKVIAKHPRSGKADTAFVTVAPALAEVTVSPASTQLAPGASKAFTVSGRMTDGEMVPVSVTWSATGGAINGSGVYTAGSQSGTFRVIARASDDNLADTSVVTITQPQATLQALVLEPGTGSAPAGAPLQFVASATWSDGSTSLPPITWSASGGTITSEGRWSAPAQAGTYRVMVRNSGGTVIVADTSTMSVVLAAPSVSALKISPKTTSATGGQTLQFSASATWTDGSTTLPPLQWSATGGEISQNGTWAAPPVAGTFKVVVKQSGVALADTATVSVTTVPRVTAIKVSPGLAATGTSKTIQFAATATWSDGESRPVTFIWSTTGGIITSSGFYTAGMLAGQFLVAATCTGCAVTDTVAVTVVESESSPTPSLTQLVLNPSSFSLAAGGSRALSVGAMWSDGSTAVPTLAWDATGGAMQGLNYVAGATAGTYRVIVRHQDGTRADTSVVTITSGPAAAGDTIQSLTVSPDPASVPPGFSVPFTVTAKLVDGRTITPAVTWSTTGGGTINSSGVYAAGPASGQYQVIATCAGCTVADTAVVLVGSAPPPSGSAVPLALRRLDGGTGAVLVSNGIPLPPGTLSPTAAGSVALFIGGAEVPAYVEILKGKHKDGSARSVLVQFNWPASGGTQAAIEFNVTPAQPRLTKSPITALVPAAVALPTDPEYLVRTEVVGVTKSRATTPTSPAFLQRYETDYDTFEQRQWAAYGVSWSALNYYDGVLQRYAFWARTGNAVLWERATRVAADFRVNYLELNAYGAAERWAMLEGLKSHYWLTGDDRSRDAVYKTAENLHRSRGRDRLLNTWDHGWMDNRTQAAVLSSKVYAMELEAPSFGVISSWADSARVDLNRILTTQTAEGSYRFAVQCGESSNFMTGLLNSAYVAYYDKFEADARILGAVKRSLDWLWSTQWSPSAMALNYYSGNCPNVGGPTPYADLNGIFVEAWGWYYKQSGDLNYRTQGDMILQGGVQGAWLAGAKQFNQHYKNSWRYLWYR